MTPGPHWPGHSVLVVPVPPLEELLRARTRHHDAAYLSSDPSFAHAHLTLLGPFVPLDGLTPTVRRRVAAVLAGYPPWTAELDRVDRFPDGMVHLRPRDEAPFRTLTADLAAAFPDHQPYAGRHPDPRPHVTLDRVGPGVDVDVVRGWVADLVPVRLPVEEVRLSWYEQHACRTLATWSLGTR